MIRCNLSVLLAERNLRISIVSKETGISRTTLTSLASNANMGIQLETINSLCNYLRTEPDKLLQYLPYEIKFVLEDEFFEFPVSATSDPSLVIFHTMLTMLVTGRRGPVEYDLIAVVKKVMMGDSPSFLVEISFDDPSGENELATEKNNTLLKQFMQDIPVPFQEDLSRRLLETVKTRLGKEFGIVDSERIDVDFSWPFARYYEHQY